MSRAYLVRHLVLSLVLTLGLFGALAAVYALDSGSTPQVIGTTPLPVPTPRAPAATPGLAYPDPVVEIGYIGSVFGLRSTVGDPDRGEDDGKNLTFDSSGGTNNTRIWVDGDTPMLGTWDVREVEAAQMRGGVLSGMWEFNGVRVSQEVRIVAGTSTLRLDTMRIEYLLENTDSRDHDVGLRIMIDTLIGNNDGVPFVVPGRDGITDRAVDLQGAAVPDFVQALEQADLVNPGVIVNLTLAGGEATRPDRLVLCGWSNSDMAWDMIQDSRGEGTPLRRGGRSSGPPDSAAGLFFNPAPLEPGQTREIVTFYGLGSISSTETGNPALSLTFAQQVYKGDQFYIVAMVVNPQEGQSLRLNLPAGVGLASGGTAEKPVTFAPGDEYTQVSWLAEALEPLQDGQVQVTLLPDNLSEAQGITVLVKGVTR